MSRAGPILPSRYGGPALALAAALALACGAEPGPSESTSSTAAGASTQTIAADPAGLTTPEAAPEVGWPPGPAEPEQIGAATRPRLVRLTAHWCHWCRVFEHEVLPDPNVRRVLAREFETWSIDVDAHPRWMDLPGIEGLPALLFFDAQGGHVLTRSGYRLPADVVTLLGAVANGLRAGELEPYPAPALPQPLTSFEPMGAARAAAELERLEGELYILVNSNDGGFSTPARHPYPGVLLELQRWRTRTERGSTWIELTASKALRGHSPRLDGEPLAGLGLGVADLISLSAKGPLDDGWREAVDHLPDHDPYRGLQDPVDHGVFRYSAGPGWYHPHFERRALDNLAWALLLRERDREQEAGQIYAFVVEAFGARGRPLDTSQRSDPFYFRLRADERQGVPAPQVAPLWTLEVQARAARFDPSRCALLERVPTDVWPRAHWVGEGQDEASSPAATDAAGELLIALAGCSGQAARARALAQTVLERWRSPGLVVDARLPRLALGVCRAAPEHCAVVMAAVEGLAIDLRFGPPLAELSILARGPNYRAPSRGPS